jgi:HD-like signal output (HDOD) protein
MIAQAQALIEDVTDVPSLPEIFIRVNEAVNNPRSSLEDVGKVISEDTGLTARLLKIVNSAFYGFPSQIDTISRAVTIVGTQQLRDLALATSVIRLFRGIPHDLIDVESFWRHSVACGITARILATYRREANVERFFVAGILHDIGRLIICLKRGDLMREILPRVRDGSNTLRQLEMEVLGYDHASVGGALIQAWKLPASLEEVILCHHSPLESSRYPVEAAVIHVADIITHALQLGNSGESFVPLLEVKAWDRLALPVSILPPTIDQVDRQYQDAVQMILPESQHG